MDKFTQLSIIFILSISFSALGKGKETYSAISEEEALPPNEALNFSARVKTPQKNKVTEKVQIKEKTIQKITESHPEPTVDQKTLATDLRLQRKLELLRRENQRLNQELKRLQERPVVSDQISMSSSTASSPSELEPEKNYDPVIPHQIDSVAERLVKVEKILRVYGLAYDYRKFTNQQLEEIFEKLNQNATPLDQRSSQASFSPASRSKIR